MNHGGLEIERKYLIRMPDESQLAAMPDCEIWNIAQTYLKDAPNGDVQRVRRILSGDAVQYVHTVKHRLNALSQQEWEREISRVEYDMLLKAADPNLRTIQKRRYRIPYEGQLLEIDIYAFWQDRATLEIELKDEAQTAHLPNWLKIVRELTGERAYKNRFLAEKIPMEALDE